MKKICFFNSYPDWGGGVKFYIDFALGLKQLGYSIFGFCYPNSLLSKAYEEAGIPVQFVKVNNRSAFNPFRVFRLVRQFNEISFDAIIFTTSEDLKLGSFAAKIAGISKIIYRRGLAVPIKNRLTNRLIFKYILTHILANSEETKRTILKHLSGVIKPDDIKVIYNGLAIQSHPNQPLSRIQEYPKNGIVLGNAGRLVPQKGHFLLLDIAERLKEMGLDFTLFIAGAGGLQHELENAIRTKGLTEHVFLIGYVDDIARFMYSIDIFLLTSLWEGFGYVLSEAALQKKPSVAFAISSNPEIVESGKTGLLVPVNDINAFAEAIIELARNRDLRLEYGDAAFQKVKDDFEINGQIKKFEQFLLC